jgi:hypothetical protein
MKLDKLKPETFDKLFFNESNEIYSWVKSKYKKTKKLKTRSIFEQPFIKESLMGFLDGVLESFLEEKVHKRPLRNLTPCG